MRKILSIGVNIVLFNKSKKMKTTDLKTYLEQGMSGGFIACSKNISDSGYIKIRYVMADWWIKAENEMSYSCCPSEKVYFNKK